MNALRRLRAGAATAAVLLMLATMPPVPAHAADRLSEDDRKCLACHAQEGITKTFEKGDTLALRVDGEQFARSIHAPLGCAACHSEVDLKSHPGGGTRFDTAREFAVAQAGACRQCHEEVFKLHQGSIHALRLGEGNPVAPTCAGCHGSHSVSPKTAYQTCVTCHAAALAEHRGWLPNAESHHEVVSCAACHAPAALRMVDLRLYDRTARTWVAEKEGQPWFEKLARSIDADGNGLDAAELRSLLKAINPEGTAVPKTLRGRIELRAGVEAHRLSEKSKALKACDNCHREGAEPFQNVAVSVTGPDGRPRRHTAQKQVLGSALAVESLPEFYAIGGTRSTFLDVLFLIALLGGIAFPAGHMTVRWLYRKFFA